MSHQFAARISRSQHVLADVMRFINESRYTQRGNSPDICDFAIGNPHEMPLEGITDALQRWSVPQNKDWFAYKMSERTATTVVAESLRKRTGLPFEPDAICMTNGAFAALAVALHALIDPGDEVIFNTPPWFFYESLIVELDGRPVRVKVRADDFDLDIEAIRAAITPKTRAIIVNSPNNPTGKIYPPDTLRRLAAVLDDASRQYGRTIYLLSDEAYNRIVFDGKPYPSPCQFYPNTLVLYTYGKTLLSPGERIGYIALPPTMPDNAEMAEALTNAQFMVGFAFPNAVLQHALGDLEQQSIDITHLQRKRDRMVAALTDMGYQVHRPEGTFYLLPRAPMPDDWAFIDMLADRHIYCLPGTVVEMPGYFRISLTANDGMIERGLPGFRSAIEQARAMVRG